jgi:5-dehydro-2-deoxygluconokinase
MNRTELDLICIGRAAVDLYGEQIGSPLEEVQSFDKSVGGCAANIAIGTARQGLKSAMLTRVGDEHMGRFVRNTLAAEGVDVSHVKTDPERLTALVLLSVADRNTFPLIFYRENCADMALEPEDFDAAFIQRAKAVLITGTHLSQPNTKAACEKAIAAAKAGSTRVVLDIDYRPVLWKLTGHGLGEERYVKSEQVTAEMRPLLASCDLIVGTEEEILIAGGEGDPIAALRSIRKHSGAVIVMKRGALGCVIFAGEIPDRVDGGMVCEGVPVDVLNVLGAGDAFMSGFLRGWIPNEPLDDCAAYANAMGALVVSRHTCSTAMPSREELDSYVSRAAKIPRIDLDPELDALHRKTYYRKLPDELCILAFDHRRQLEEIVEDLALVQVNLQALKDAIAEAGVRAVERTQIKGRGMIIDGQYGSSALARMTRLGWFVARPIELPKQRPVRFIGEPNPELEILTWPSTQVVKCLVHCHPHDPEPLRLAEESKLLRLQAACHRLHREWLLEVIPEEHGAPDPAALPKAMERLVKVGLEPDWWKIPAPLDWEPIETIVKRDPTCRGVLLLGLSGSEEEVAASFSRAPAICRGFAVGRTIFLEPARRWLAGELSEAGLIDAVSSSFERLIRRWIERAR